jgi:hypothetical protein
VKNKEGDLSEQTYNFFIWMLSGISLSKHRQELRSQNTNRYEDSSDDEEFRKIEQVRSSKKRRMRFNVNILQIIDENKGMKYIIVIVMSFVF